MCFDSHVNKKCEESSFPHSLPLQPRLRLYLATFVALMVGVLVVIFALLGVFSTVESETESQLSAQLDNFASNVEMQYRQLAAGGIDLSSMLSATIENHLSENNITFNQLTNDIDAIDAVELAIFPDLESAFRLNSCSGSFMILNTTVNTSLENSDFSRSGVYIKAVEIGSQASSVPNITLYRGTAQIMNMGLTVLYENWELEFDISRFPDFPEMTEQVSQVGSYFFTEASVIGDTLRKNYVSCCSGFWRRE